MLYVLVTWTFMFKLTGQQDTRWNPTNQLAARALLNTGTGCFTPTKSYLMGCKLAVYPLGHKKCTLAIRSLPSILQHSSEARGVWAAACTRHHQTSPSNNPLPVHLPNSAAG